MNKAIITVAPTGEGPTKAMNPATPITPEEIADSVYEAYLAGAAIAHVHVRDDNGNPTMNTEKFKKTVELIRGKCDIVINTTTSGDINAGDEIRMAHLPVLKPAMATFDCGTMNWGYSEIFQNSPQFLEKLGMRMQELDIKPEVEIFDLGMMDNALHYIKTGVLKMPVHFQIILGSPGGIPATIENLCYITRMVPEGCTWSAFGVGRNHIPMMSASLLLGGHVRVGFEDNIYYSKGVLAKSNAELVERAVRLCREFQREVATPQDVREMFNLKNF